MSAAKITGKWPPKSMKTWVNTVFDDLRKEVPKDGRVFVFAFQLPYGRAVMRMSQCDRQPADADYHEKLLAETEKKPGYIRERVPEILAKAWRNGTSRAALSLWKGTKMVRAIEC